VASSLLFIIFSILLRAFFKAQSKAGSTSCGFAIPSGGKLKSLRFLTAY
jgi:hypothetical protein